MNVQATPLTEAILAAAARDEFTRDDKAAVVKALYRIGAELDGDRELPSVACIFYKSALELDRAVV